MKRIGLVLAGWLMVGGLWYQTAYAQETLIEPAIINNPVTGWELTKSFAGYLEPGADWFLGFKNGSFEGFSGALYTAKSNGFPLASIRLGFGLSDPVSYGTFALDLPGLAGRFIPSTVKGVSPGTLNGVLAFATKFVRIGPSVGLDWATNKVRYGLSFGAAVTTKF